MSEFKRTRCLICNEWYIPNQENNQIHAHPEPQSGRYRDSLIAFNRLYIGGYNAWKEVSREGKDWARYERGEIKQKDLPLHPHNKNPLDHNGKEG